MKKYLLLIFSFMLLLNPILVGAVSASDEYIDLSNYTTNNFKGTLEEESIELKNTKYSETDNQITIYMFRGKGCHFCQDFLNFLNSISEEYGKYFKLVSFEVWNNKENSDLMDKISTFLNNPAGGVPYIIIGEEVFGGYASEYDDGIKDAIKKLYSSSDKYDAFEEYNKAVKQAKKSASGDSGLIIFFNILVCVCSSICICLYTKKQNEKLYQRVESLIKKNNKNEEVEKNIKNGKKK